MAFAMDMTWAGEWLIGVMWRLRQVRRYRPHHKEFAKCLILPLQTWSARCTPEARTEGIIGPSLARILHMNQPRFHCPFPLAARQRLELPEAIAHHAVRVLRLRDGSDIILFDGRGGHYPATLHIEGKRAWASTGDHIDAEVELPVRTVLVQGIASGDKMDWVVEKAVEMGVSQLVPIAAQRSVIQLSADRRTKRLHHWQRIAVSASEQCGRNRIMEVAPVQSLEEWLKRPDPELLRLVCHPNAPQSLEDAVQHHTGPLALMVGPEGGWSDDELELMRGGGLSPVRFGRRVLRTETAGVALMAALAAIKRWN